MDHREDAAIPSGRRRFHLRGNLSDLEVDGVKHAGELVSDSFDEQRFEPLGDFQDDGVHAASSVQLKRPEKSDTSTIPTSAMPPPAMSCLMP